MCEHTCRNKVQINFYEPENEKKTHSTNTFNLRWDKKKCFFLVHFSALKFPITKSFILEIFGSICQWMVQTFNVHVILVVVFALSIREAKTNCNVQCFWLSIVVQPNHFREREKNESIDTTSSTKRKNCNLSFNIDNTIRAKKSIGKIKFRGLKWQKKKETHTRAICSGKKMIKTDMQSEWTV